MQGGKIHSEEAEAKGGGEVEKEQLVRTESSLEGCRAQGRVQQSLTGQKHGSPCPLFRTPAPPRPYPCICFPCLSLQTDFPGSVWMERDPACLPGV